jgi:hypothetical protein
MLHFVRNSPSRTKVWKMEKGKEWDGRKGRKSARKERIKRK